jgi:hypothetical protein
MAEKPDLKELPPEPAKPARARKMHATPPDTDDPEKIYGKYDPVGPAAKRAIFPDAVFDPSKHLNGFDYAADNSIAYLRELETTYREVARLGWGHIRERVQLIIFINTIAVQAAARQKALGWTKTADEADALRETDMATVPDHKLIELAGRKDDKLDS